MTIEIWMIFSIGAITAVFAELKEKYFPSKENRFWLLHNIIYLNLTGGKKYKNER